MTATPDWNVLQKKLDSLQRATATFTICDDADLRTRLGQAKAELAAAEARLKSLAEESADTTAGERRAERARTELAAAQAAYDERAVTLTFQAMPREQLEALERQHPATEEEEADGEEFHLDGFAPAVLSAASTDGMPVEAAEKLMRNWSAADFRALWSAAYGIQHQGRADLGKG
ncbi:hypothetical protein IQ62_00085 [Streptomyces scabiei]|uniref:hypothetical protein n=1 Tax=Streptomyces scabiei TaxID=1930 RepID=UPI0004E6FF6B|nr:hypothetical protein [Streptomyces scabiei]KFG02761.1 hypothetical protein IQ62_00085 [Streptomyces scabiei]